MPTDAVTCSYGPGTIVCSPFSTRTSPVAASTRRAYWWLSSTILLSVAICSSYAPMKWSVGPATISTVPVSVSLILAYCCSSSCSALRLRALFTIGAYHATVGPLTTVTLDGPSSTSCSSGFRKLRGMHDMMVARVCGVTGACARERERARAAGARCEGERRVDLTPSRGFAVRERTPDGPYLLRRRSSSRPVGLDPRFLLGRLGLLGLLWRLGLQIVQCLLHGHVR